jgi:hypothetical protein
MSCSCPALSDSCLLSTEVTVFLPVDQALDQVQNLRHFEGVQWMCCVFPHLPWPACVPSDFVQSFESTGIAERSQHYEQTVL